MIAGLPLMRRFAQQTTASASVEFALMVPMLVILMFGGAEAGHFVWTQHKLTEAVRDGARYASRLPVDGTSGVCDGATETISTDQINRIKLVTLTGQLANTGALTDLSYWRVVPGWTPAQVTVTVNCQAYVNTGIYTALGGAGPVVTVRASGVTYPSLFRLLAGLSRGVSLSAKSNAAVIGL
jgi:Flp pilus assembly protein TadG